MQQALYYTALKNLENEIKHWAPDIEKLTFGRRLTYDIKSNWKNNILSPGKTWGKSLQDGFFYNYRQNSLSFKTTRANLNSSLASSVGPSYSS